MSERKQKRGCWSKVGLTSLIFLTVVLSVLAIAYSRTDLGSAAADYEKNRATAEKVGLFFTKEQADVLFKVPEEDNGAKLMKFAKVKEIGVPDYLTDDEIAVRKQLIEEYVQTLEAAANRKYLISAKSSADLTFVFGSETKNAVKLLSRMTKYSSDHGDKEGCKRYLRIATRLTNGAGDDKDEIPILIRIACAAITEARLQGMIPKFANDPEWLAIIEASLKDLDKPYDLLTVVKLQHLQSLEYADIIKKESIPVKEIFRSDSELPLSMRLNRFLPRYQPAIRSRIHEYFGNLGALLPADPYDWNQMQKAGQFSTDFLNRKGWSYEALMTAEFDGMIRAVWKQISSRNALMQAVEILKSKADPAKGLPLLGRYHLDLDGKPLRIKHLDKGWIVYSIWDKTDDGGMDLKKGHGDFVVHLSMATAPHEIAPRGQKFLNPGLPSPSGGPAPPKFSTPGQGEPE